MDRDIEMRARVEVIPADREAWIEYEDFDGAFADKVRTGSEDATCGLQIFARHRLAFAATRAVAADGEEEEAYEIGRREGYESAVQDIDVRTGGDGEYFASTLPGRGCPDAPTMIEGIVDRFAALSASPLPGREEIARERWRMGYPDGIPGTPEYEPPARVCNLCDTVQSRCQCDTPPTEG